MDKEGQFYLLAAIVIIVLLLSYVGVSNYINKKNATKVYDVKEELNIEGNNVLEFGILNSDTLSLSEAGTEIARGEDAIIEHFMTLYETYLESVGENIDIYYILGNKDAIKAYKIGETSGGELILNFGGTRLTENIIKKSIEELKGERNYYTVSEGKVTITIEGNNYDFDLKAGENFYFIISQTVGGEQYVDTN